MFDILPLTHSNHSVVYDPFKAMDDLEKRFFNPFTGFSQYESMEPFRTDIKEEENAFVLQSDLPGFNKDDISVDVEEDYLTIKAERHSEHEDKDKKSSYIRCERTYGKYQRSFDISGIDADAISGKYENGVLTLTLPKKAPVAPTKRKLELQ